MLKIYGANLSGPSNRIRFIANHMGLPYDYIQVNLREGEHRKEEFLKINPIGKIPVIDDDGFILFESGAIVRYLCDKNKSDLFPEDRQTRAIIDQWADFAINHIMMALNRVVFNRLFAPMIGVDVDENSLKDGLAFLDRFLPNADEQLKANRYFAGDKLSIADMTLLSALDPCEAVDVELSSYGNIDKWRKDLKGKNFYTKCHKSYEDNLKQFAK